MGTAIKYRMPGRVKPSFVIFDIRALWRYLLPSNWWLQNKTAGNWSHFEQIQFYDPSNFHSDVTHGNRRWTSDGQISVRLQRLPPCLRFCQLTDVCALQIISIICTQEDKLSLG